MQCARLGSTLGTRDQNRAPLWDRSKSACVCLPLYKLNFFWGKRSADRYSAYSLSNLATISPRMR